MCAASFRTADRTVLRLRSNGSSEMATGSSGERIHGRCFGQSGFARHAVMAASSCVPVPASTDLAALCLLGCGVQTGYGAVSRVAKPPAGSSAVVFGVGAVGLSAIWAAARCQLRALVAVDVNVRALSPWKR